MTSTIEKRKADQRAPLVPNWAGQFDSFDDWVNNATRYLSDPYCPLDGVGHVQKAICVDALGRRCQVGADFMRARDEGTFPIRFFWNCERPS